jgi:hypothetical protein
VVAALFGRVKRTRNAHGSSTRAPYAPKGLEPGGPPPAAFNRALLRSRSYAHPDDEGMGSDV